MSIETIVIAVCMGLTISLSYAVYLLSQRLQNNYRVIEGLQKDISALCAGAAGVSEHLDKIEDQSRYLADRQDQMNTYGNAERPYIQAMRLAENGSGVEDLMKTCDLSQEEASLIRKMYNHQTDRNPGRSLDLILE